MSQLKFRLKVVFTILFISAITFATTKTTNLVCEYHTNPIGIDVVKPRFSWQFTTNENNFKQTAYEIRVANTSANFNTKNLLWSSGKITNDQSVNIEYEGIPLKSMQRAYWQVRAWDNNGKATNWSEPAYWEAGILDPNAWKAKWITMKTEDKTGQCFYFRNEFAISKKISSARVYVTSLGLYQLFLNGKKVGNDLFTPGWTTYSKRIQYQTYDITNLLQTKNTVGAMLSEGWYRGRLGWKKNRKVSAKQLALLVQIQVNYTDGTSQIIITDKDWKTSYGALLESSIYDGEIYDAQLEQSGWSTTGFNDNAWKNAQTIEYSKSMLVAPQGVAVKAIQEITPIKSITTPKNETVFDMGQNMVGWVRLKVKGNKGDTITLKFAEVLNKAGNFYTDNLRSAKSTDIYILKGNEEEVFEPFFTFHGFRFVKIEGLRNKITMDNITGIVIHSDMKPTGNFSCSDTLINKLQQNIQWGQKGNFLDVPTDCPQRDERLGWTGDAQVFAMTAAYNFDVAAFYTKWLGDMAADQLPDGKIPNVIPNVLGGKDCSTAWADACVIIPWSVYRVYGDKRILEVQYKSMKAWIDYMKQRAGKKHLWLGDVHYGDWLDFSSNKTAFLKGSTDRDLIANAYFYYSTSIFAKIAGIIGEKEDADSYTKLAENVKKAFQQEFVTPNGRMVTQTQTAYSLALAFGLLPENLKERVGTLLATDVRQAGHLTTGFVGTPLLCSTLSAIGRDSLAFKLVTRKAYPSWLYPVTQGATTIWERWDGQKPDSTFQSEGMNSFNHYAYGAIGEWLYTHVAGLNIDPENPGYKHIIFSPHVGGGLTNAKAEFLSLFGPIKAAWEINNKTFFYNITIPPNTTGTVIFDTPEVDKMRINNLPISSEIKRSVVTTASTTTLELGSGSYEVSYPTKF